MGYVEKNARNGNYRTKASCAGYVTSTPWQDETILTLGEQTLDALGADVAGIDVGRTKDGHLHVIEVNISFETWERTQRFIGHNVWADVVDLLLSRIEKRRKEKITPSLFAAINARAAATSVTLEEAPQVDDPAQVGSPDGERLARPSLPHGDSWPSFLEGP